MLIYPHNKEEQAFVLPFSAGKKGNTIPFFGVLKRELSVCSRFYVSVNYSKEVLFISRDIPQLNSEIRDKELRVITADGEQLGIMSAKEALHEAELRGQDLVKIAPQAKPPVCKIMDYSKFRYEQSKREKENRKKQKTVDTKEIRLSLNIDIGDFNTKVNQARKFLEKGDKLKVSLRLRGREMAHSDLGVANMQRFAQALGEDVSVDKAPKLEGRQILMFLSLKQAK